MALILSVLILSGIGLLLWMHFFELKRYEISRHDAVLNKSLAAPLRIMHLSDIHFAGPDPKLAAFFDRLALEEIDFVFLTGDILDCMEGLAACRENLRKLKPRAGMYAVLGNHDYYNYTPWDIIAHNFPRQTAPKRLQDTEGLVAALEEDGCRVLRNETVELDWHGSPLLIHGLDDATSGKANLRSAMQNFDTAKINILLTHTIDVFLDIGPDEIDLSFSGHSHGGQICFPWIGPVITHTVMGPRYASGVIAHKGAVCCVSRGVGNSRYLPVRLLCRPEAVGLSVTGRRTEG